MATIKPVEIVDDEERNAYLVNRYGDPTKAIEIEHRIYNKMQELCPEYTGAFWRMYTVGKRTPTWYMAPAINDRKLAIRVPTNGYEGLMSADAAGIVVCLVILNQLCWENPESKEHYDAFVKLQQFSWNHKEAPAIMGAID